MDQNPTVEALSHRLASLEEELTILRKENNHLKKSLDRYRSIVKNTRDAVVVIQNEKIKLANALAVKMSGLSLNGQQGPNRSFLEWIHPEDRETVISNYTSRLKGKKAPDSYDVRLLDKDQNYRWMSVRPVAMTWEEKPALLVFMSDISKRKQMEEELKELERNYREIFNSTNEAIFVQDMQTRNIVDVNKAAGEMLGYSPEEIKELAVEDFSQGEPPFSHKEIEQWMETAIKEGTQVFEWITRRKDGGLFWTEVNLKKAQIGPQTYMLACVRDVDSRKTAEDALRESEEKYRVLVENARQGIENSPNAIFSVDRAGNIQMWNSACESVFQYEKSILGQSYEMLLSEKEDHAAVQAIISNVFQGHSMGDIDLSFQCKNGRERFMVSRLYPMYDSENQVRACVFGNTDITERKLAETALRDSESRYRMLTQNLPGIVYRVLLRENNHMIFFNDLLQPLTGYKAEELQFGKDCAMEPFILSEDREKVVHIVQQAVEDETEFDVDYRVMHKDGSVKWFHETGKVVYGNDREPLYIDGLIFDITERKQAEEALKESEERFKQLSEASWEAIAIHDQGVLLRANRQFFDLFGYEPEELLHANVFPVIITPQSLQQINEQIDSGGSGPYEVMGLKKDGSAFPMVVRGKTIEYYGKNVWVAAIRDISERKKAEEQIRESEKKYRSIFENIQDIYFEVNRDGVITEISPSLKKYLRYSHEELIGKSVYSFFKDREEGKAVTKKILKTGRSGEVEFDLADKDGTVHKISMNMTFVRDEKNGSIKNVGTMRDITERVIAEKEKQELEERLIRSQKMEALGFLAGGVAHDLNNVLSGIVSYPDLLLMDIPEDSPLREPILTIQASGRKASMIVQDLLTLARRGVTATETLNLNKIISDYFRSPEHQKIMYSHHRVHIQTNLQAELPHIKGSDIHLKKTIMNLMVNAVEALPEGGDIMVSTENKYVDRPIRGYENVEEGDYVVLTVKDNGVGIAFEDLKRIFEPFYTKKVMGRSGTGLGMAVVWGTVQDHKGYIDVHSSEGNGATFELYFPITREAIDQEKSAIPLEAYMGKGESILVIDDVREQREIASNILTKLNYSPHAVSGGEEAVEYLKTSHPDLILLDMIMDNGIDGLETYKRILQFRSDQKAIVVSGFSETERVKEAQKLGAGEYIRKPYTLETLGVALRKELDG